MQGIGRWWVLLLTIDRTAVAAANLTACQHHHAQLLASADTFLRGVQAALAPAPTVEGVESAAAAAGRAAALTELYVRTWSTFQLAVRSHSFCPR